MPRALGGAVDDQEEPVADPVLGQQDLAGIELDLVGGLDPTPDLGPAQPHQQRVVRQPDVALVPCHRAPEGGNGVAHPRRPRMPRTSASSSSNRAMSVKRLASSKAMAGSD